jgi:uridine monophosphate synthetase
MMASETFFARLERRARAANSLLCVGLDPHLELLPEASAGAAKEFCLRLIEQTSEFACAFKPNSAFFEMFGAPGWTVLREVIAAVPPEIPVILDAKRGDIASTARAYAQAAFEGLGASAVTLNPYLGYDAVEPFLEDPGRGVFLLCKTSNPGADDLQNHAGSIEPLYLRVARLAEEWNRRDNLGLVVGATQPQALADVRAVTPELWILAPGIGVQGGDLTAALRAGLRIDGYGMLIPVSRSIAAADSPAREAARLRAAIRERQTDADAVNNGKRTTSKPAFNQAPEPQSQLSASPAQSREAADAPRTKESALQLSDHLAELADELLAAGCVQFGDFMLKSGERSPIYFDLRLLAGRPKLLAKVAEAYLPVLERLEFDRLAAVPYAGLPIATAVSLRSGCPLVYPRKERKTYGTGASVEGGFESGEKVLLLDDLATTGGSKFEAIEQLAEVGLQAEDVVVLSPLGSWPAGGEGRTEIRQGIPR